MREFYDVIYELILRGYVISLYEVGTSNEVLTVHVIHKDETYNSTEEKEWYYWRAGMPTARFINVDDINLYPKKSEIKYFTISSSGKSSERVFFYEETFARDVWMAAKTIR